MKITTENYSNAINNLLISMLDCPTENILQEIANNFAEYCDQAESWIYLNNGFLITLRNGHYSSHSLDEFSATHPDSEEIIKFIEKNFFGMHEFSLIQSFHDNVMITTNKNYNYLKLVFKKEFIGLFRTVCSTVRNELYIFSEIGKIISYALYSRIMKDEIVLQKMETEKNSDRMKYALDGTTLGLWDWDIVNEEMYYDNNWLKILGYPPEKLSTAIDFFISHIHPEDRELVTENLIEHLRGNTTQFKVIYRVSTSCGEWKWIKAMGKVVASTENGKPARMVGTYTDISKEKEVEEALNEANERYKSFFEQNSIGIIIGDVNKKICDCNTTVEYMLGYSKKELLKKNIMEILNDDTKMDFNNILVKLKTRGVKSVTFESDLTKANWSSMWGRITISGIFSKNNYHYKEYFLIMIEDITEIKRSEKALLEAERLTERSKRIVSLGTMASGIAHEINQPLTSLKAGIDGLLLLNKMQMNLSKEDIFSTLQIVAEDAQRIGSIINHMRMLIRSNNVQSILLDLNQVILKSRILYQQKIFENRIMLNFELKENLSPIMGNQVILEQIIINLINNAIDSLSEVDKNDKWIKVQTGSSEENVFLRISDNGPGINEEHLKNIFDPFFTTKKSKGMGLGLSIVENLVITMNGTITAENIESNGAAFTILIPFEKHDH